MARKRGKAGSEAKEIRKSRVAGSPIRNLILFAIASAIIGVAFILYPNVIERYCGYIIGGVIAVIGIANVICYFVKKTIDGVYRSEFAVGIIETAAGAYVALLSDGTLAFIVLVLGILCAVDGLLKIQYTLDLARMHYAKWWLPLLMGALGLGIGVIIVMGLLADLAGKSVNNQLIYIGAVFCLNCVLDIVTIVVIAVRNAKAAHVTAQSDATPDAPVSGNETAYRPVSQQPNLQPVPPQPMPPQPVPPQPMPPQPVPPQPVPPQPVPPQPVPPQPVPQPEAQPAPEPVDTLDSAPTAPANQEKVSAL